MIERIGNVKMNMSFYPGEDFYCDGEVEDEILQIVKNTPSAFYNAVIAQKKKWPILYHLSNIRANIVDFLPITKDSSVLEIGSGCGAITGKLAEKAGKVTCIELSKKRSTINAYRNQEKSNIEIMVGNFQDIEQSLTEQYDYITLIGVFEYAAEYIESNEDSYQEFLIKIASHLKKNGKVIMAIENKYGMKYFAGCVEDHLNECFKGIEGYSEESGVKTFSRQQLIRYAKGAGLDDVLFYYPYPDYKFPQVIYSDEYLPKPGELKHYMNLNFDQDRLKIFDETKAYDNIIEDGLFPQYSNSYLMIAGK